MNRIKKVKFHRKNLITAVLLLAVLAGAGLLIKDYMHARAEVKRIESAEAGSGEVGALVRELKVHLELPVTEVPTVATVNDLTSLEGQKFFEKAEKGDKVIVYPSFGRAILYRPTEKMIIEYAPVNYN